MPFRWKSLSGIPRKSARLRSSLRTARTLPVRASARGRCPPLSASLKIAAVNSTLPLLLSVLLPALLSAADPYQAQRLKRFNDAKFGMFIHWGPYSLASVEASWPIMRPANWGISEAEYRALPARFNPVKFDAAAWVRLAQAAGQRYMVLTSKHHDGFAMYDSMFTDYKITKTPYGKDVSAALAPPPKPPACLSASITPLPT